MLMDLKLSNQWVVIAGFSNMAAFFSGVYILLYAI